MSEPKNIIQRIEELENVLKEVSSFEHQDEYTDEEIEDYVKAIKQQRVKRQINTLTEKMKNTIDIEEKKKLADRIKNMKEEVLKW